MAVRYAPGECFALVRSDMVVLVDSSVTPFSVAVLWDALVALDKSDIVSVLDVVAAVLDPTLRELPDFALIVHPAIAGQTGADPETLHVAARGRMVVNLKTSIGSRTITAPEMTTWADQRVFGVHQYEAGPLDGCDAVGQAIFAISEGIVKVSALCWQGEPIHPQAAAVSAAAPPPAFARPVAPSRSEALDVGVLPGVLAGLDSIEASDSLPLFTLTDSGAQSIVLASGLTPAQEVESDFARTLGGVPDEWTESEPEAPDGLDDGRGPGDPVNDGPLGGPAGRIPTRWSAEASSVDGSQRSNLAVPAPDGPGGSVHRLRPEEGPAKPEQTMTPAAQMFPAGSRHAAGDGRIPAGNPMVGYTPRYRAAVPSPEAQGVATAPFKNEVEVPQSPSVAALGAVASSGVGGLVQQESAIPAPPPDLVSRSVPYDQTVAYSELSAFRHPEAPTGPSVDQQDSAVPVFSMGPDSESVLQAPQIAEPPLLDPPAEYVTVQVLARSCFFGHVNAPSRTSCQHCGGGLSPGAQMMARPSLGRVRFSTGEIVDLDRTIVVGRFPQRTPGTDGADQPVRLITVPSPSRDISRSHLEVRLDGWNVVLVDLTTINGSVLTRQGYPPYVLPADSPTLAFNGDIVDLGDGVELTFEGLG